MWRGGVSAAANQQEFAELTVDYITLPGWQSSTTAARALSDLPVNAQNYIRKIEQLLDVPGEL